MPSPALAARCAGRGGDHHILGTIAKSAAGPEINDLGRLSGSCVVASLDEARQRAENRDRWRHQRVAAGLLQGERVADCQRSLTGLGVRVERGDHGVGYSGLVTCDSRWCCPICAAKITERDRRELALAIVLWTRAGGRVYLMTQTFRHDVTLPIGEGLSAMQRAQRVMKATRAYKAIMAAAGAIGAVKALEVTLGENGWHPHTHTLVFARVDQLETLELVRECWRAAVERVGLGRVNEHGFDVRGGDYAAEYVAKFGKEAGAQSRHQARAWWTAAHELTKGHTKQTQRLKGATPFTLLRWCAGGDAQSGALFVEYARAFKGRAQLYWSPRLRARIDLLELQEPKRPAPRPELICTLPREDWARVLEHNARWEVLYVADRYGAVAVEELLSRMRSHRGGWRSCFRAADPWNGRMVNINAPVEEWASQRVAA